MNILLKILINTLGIMLVAYIVPGITVANLFTALIVAIVLGVINITLKPLLIILTLPINIITLGLFTLIINAFLFMLTAYIVKGFEVETFLSALLGALLLSIIHLVTNRHESVR